MKDKIIEILKFVFFILLLPLVVGSTVGFNYELGNLPEELSSAFIFGMAAYLIFHLFIYKPQGAYQYGQGLVSGVFKFFAPLVEVASFLIPIYAFIGLIGLAAAVLGFHSAKMGWYCMVFIGMTLTMHLIFASEALQAKEQSVLRPNYFFSISLIYIINIFIVAAVFYLVLKDFSFADFFGTAKGITLHAYRRVFNQLFVP